MTLRNRQPPIASGPNGVDLSSQSYAKTHNATPMATYKLCREAKHAARMPAAINALANIAADRGDTRPEGMGRCGRSRASRSRSKKSLNAIPDRYRHDDATSSN